MRGSATAVGTKMGASDGLGVASDWEVGNTHALIARRNINNPSLVICFEDGMAKSFFEESICQLYKQAACFRAKKQIQISSLNEHHPPTLNRIQEFPNQQASDYSSTAILQKTGWLYTTWQSTHWLSNFTNT